MRFGYLLTRTLFLQTSNVSPPLKSVLLSFRKFVFLISGLAILSLLLLGCDASEDIKPYQYSQPEMIDDGWETATLAHVGLQEQPIVEMVDMLLNQPENHEVHSILIIKDSFLVFEAYFKGHDFCGVCDDNHGPIVQWDMYRNHSTHSVTKSYTSTLVGIALDQGAISSVDEKMMDYMAEYAELWDGEKEGISIKDLLTMTSGLDWDEKSTPYLSEENDLGNMLKSDNPVRFIASKSAIQEPGTMFKYSGGDTNLLGQVIRKATGKSVTDFANEFLFEPMGIEAKHWKILGSDLEYLSASLKLTPREMAKLGWVFINNGFWKNNQIISLDWIEQASRSQIALDSTLWKREGYGFQWWIKPFQIGEGSVDCFMASGWGNQRIMCIPELNMVVVFTGADYLKKHNINPEILMEEYITVALE